MPCPLCDHTMQNLGLATNGRRTFWCPRCGTLKTESGDFEEYESPRWAKERNSFEVPELLSVCESALRFIQPIVEDEVHEEREGSASKLHDLILAAIAKAKVA